MDLTRATGTPADPSEPTPTTDPGHREVALERAENGTYVARNERGGTLRLSSTGSADFTPVELLLVAIAGCSAVDVDVATSRRAEPSRFVVRASGTKTRDDGGAVMADLRLTFDVRFPDGPAGDTARTVLPRALRISHDQECTVSRTVETGVPVGVELAEVVTEDGPAG